MDNTIIDETINKLNYLVDTLKELKECVEAGDMSDAQNLANDFLWKFRSLTVYDPTLQIQFIGYGLNTNNE